MFERTIGGAHYDYCAVWHGITFHACTAREAVAGLRTKLRAVVRGRHATITLALCTTQLGFCRDGVQQFCRDFDLDPSGAYTPAEIERVVRADWSRAQQYAAELHKLAQAVGYPIPQEFGSV